MVVCMAMIAVGIKIDEERVVTALHEAEERLACSEEEVILDLSSVRRIDANAISALDGLAQMADKKGVKVVLRGVNVSVYKVLKLVKLSSRFSFVD
jgi:anti-anti-sigma regulatory factor